MPLSHKKEKTQVMFFFESWEKMLMNSSRTAHISREISKNILNVYHQIQKRACVSSFLQGSLTVETALCLPVLLFAAYFLMLPLKVMEAQRRLQNVMEASVKDLTQAAYVSRLSQDLVKENAVADAAQILDAAKAGAAREKIIQAGMNKPLEHPKFRGNSSKGSIAGTENELIQMELEYEVSFSVPIFHMSPVRLSSVASRRAWVGAEGGRGRAQYSGQQAEDGWDRDSEGNIIVYIGKNGTRYHRNKNCHYINNQLKAVDGTSVDELRSSSGAKYRPCASCRPKKTGTVYIFEEGRSYHAKTDCKSIISYAKAVKLEDVKGLGPCTYCSKAA